MRKTWVARGPGGFRPTATITIVAALAVSFFLIFLTSGSGPFVFENLVYSPDLSKPWTLLTYPFATMLARVFWFALACWVTYQFLSDIERTLGAWGAALFFFSMTFLGGIGYYIGTLGFGTSAYLPSLNLPLEVVIFTWALRNWGQTVNFFGFIPVPTKVLAWLCIAAVVIELGWMNPIVGVFAAFPFAIAWPYAMNKIPFMKFGKVPDIVDIKEKKKDEREFHDYMEKVREKEQERKEKERLRKLFEDSLSEDDKD